MQFLEKLWNMQENLDILNLSQQKEEETIWCWNQINVLQSLKTQIIVNKPVYIGLSIVKLSIILMNEFWYDYVKLKYDEKSKLCYMNTDSFIVYIKIDDIYKDIAEYIETSFDTSNY